LPLTGKRLETAALLGWRQGPHPTQAAPLSAKSLKATLYSAAAAQKGPRVALREPPVD